mmetsp:Transcript_98933/g.317231  ORF Transcript_98933/g.317231 Transcript_98933/m.317231 type:complete len:761 (-) Transcript_98933:117-2399(-)
MANVRHGGGDGQEEDTPIYISGGTGSFAAVTALSSRSWVREVTTGSSGGGFCAQCDSATSDRRRGGSSGVADAIGSDDCSRTPSDFSGVDRAVMVLRRSAKTFLEAALQPMDDDMVREEAQEDDAWARHFGSIAMLVRTTASSTGEKNMWAYARSLVKIFIHSRLFDLMIGLVITVNAFMIGVELTWNLEGRSTSSLSTLEDVFLCVYLVELALRFIGEGLPCLKSNWVKFDLFLALVGVVNLWLLQIMKADGTAFGFLMVLRMLRLARLARTVRLLVKFKVLWMLVRGLLSSAGTMVYVFFLLTIILYIFSAIGVELITNNQLAKSDEEFGAIVAANFASLPDTMLTLVQFLCMDSIGSIYRPLIQKDFTLTMYFTLVILVVPIVLMNLITAIIVNSALEQASSDKEVEALYEQEKRARMIKQLRKVFLNLDQDNSGQVNRDEIELVSEVDRYFLEQATTIRDPAEVFNALNVDGRESLGIDEFCDGIWKLATSKASIEVQRMEKQVNVMFDRLKAVSQRQRHSDAKIDQILQGQALIQKSLITIQSQMARQQLAASVAGGSSGATTPTAASMLAAASRCLLETSTTSYNFVSEGSDPVAVSAAPSLLPVRVRKAADDVVSTVDGSPSSHSSCVDGMAPSCTLQSAGSFGNRRGMPPALSFGAALPQFGQVSVVPDTATGVRSPASRSSWSYLRRHSSPALAVACADTWALEPCRSRPTSDKAAWPTMLEPTPEVPLDIPSDGDESVGAPLSARPHLLI